jgi:hypothetical protein
MGHCPVGRRGDRCGFAGPLRPLRRRRPPRLGPRRAGQRSGPTRAGARTDRPGRSFGRGPTGLGIPDPPRRPGGLGPSVGGMPARSSTGVWTSTAPCGNGRGAGGGPGRAEPTHRAGGLVERGRRCGRCAGHPELGEPTDGRRGRGPGALDPLPAQDARRGGGPGGPPGIVQGPPGPAAGSAGIHGDARGRGVGFGRGGEGARGRGHAPWCYPARGRTRSWVGGYRATEAATA